MVWVWFILLIFVSVFFNKAADASEDVYLTIFLKILDWVFFIWAAILIIPEIDKILKYFGVNF